jgi:hypothetical protein
LTYGNPSKSNQYECYFVTTTHCNYVSVYANNEEELAKTLIAMGYFPSGPQSKSTAKSTEKASRLAIDPKLSICFAIEYLNLYRRLMLQCAISQLSYIKAMMKVYGFTYLNINFQLIYRKFIEAYNSFQIIMHDIDNLKLNTETIKLPMCLGCDHDKGSTKSIHIAADGCFRASRLNKVNQVVTTTTNPIRSIILPRADVQERLKTYPKSSKKSKGN